MTDKVPVDHLSTLLLEEAAASDKIKQYEGVAAKWKAHRAGLRQQIMKELQGRVGTVGGVEVVTATPSAKFAHAQFTKDWPSIAELFQRPVVSQALDVEALMAAEPELAKKYFVVTFTNRTQA